MDRSTRTPGDSPMSLDAESRRLREAADGEPWRLWGPYLAERQWATVREDYSAHGDCWSHFPHDHARSRAYRWGEDGLLGICDDQCRLCFALALWNEKDPILKERLFGLTGPEGNHGEDVKEHYFYLDNTPTHSYMRALYKYPREEFPYARLVEEGRRRGRHEPEFELGDTGVLDRGCFDVEATYAKASAREILIEIRATNHGEDAAPLHILPTLWFRNTWSWGRDARRPRIEVEDDGSLRACHDEMGEYRLSLEGTAATARDEPGARPVEVLVTDNESNAPRLWGVAPDASSAKRYYKDAFHERVVHGRKDAVNPARVGSKGALWFRLHLEPGATATIRLRLSAEPAPREAGASFDRVLSARAGEADEFYARRGHARLTDAERLVARQAVAGLLSSKQFYEYDVRPWLEGDPGQPAPPRERAAGRNADWPHLNNRDVLLMPDKWEYPWYAAWDLAFHCVAAAPFDPDLAKDQLVLLLREWYMHPSGQIPAYEFAFGDVNPPVHAWAVWRVYKMAAPRGQRDRVFLARCFQKLLLNFTWWVNRKDPSGKNLFAGGFLGLDNIGVFDRSRPLPTGGHLEQADGTAWMAFYCGTMLSIALELARHDPAYEDIATKFFEHFIAITDAMNTLGGSGLWDDGDGFYYDQVRLGEHAIPLKVRSLVGIVPLLAVEVLDDQAIAALPDFRRRMEWFLANRRDLPWHATCACAHGGTGTRLLAIPTKERLERTVARLLDEREFLSPFGIRSLSRRHEHEPFEFHASGETHRVEYCPGESTTGLFGGNSNWRGPIWFPLNFLIVEALERYHHFYGEAVTVELPAGSGRRATLQNAADEIRSRLARLFLPGEDGRPCHAGDERFARDPAWRDLVYFHEHFHPETGRGLGATHQTGWTALIALMLGAGRGSQHASASSGGPARGRPSVAHEPLVAEAPGARAPRAARSR